MDKHTTSPDTRPGVKALALRLWPALAAFVLLAVLVLALAPVKAGLLLYAACKIALAAAAGYGLDRWFYRYRRLHEREGLDRALGELTRALVFAACALIVALVP